MHAQTYFLFERAGLQDVDLVLARHALLALLFLLGLNHSADTQ